ncbi:MAG: HIT domain-containing protein [Candidatus Pacebacteria bacterium]|nr:HIT domain-containing protein [Candidatus Paceibacterota bacterium]
MQCLFCDIANGKTDTDIVYQDDKFAVFRDIEPRAPIHLLIVPKKHMESIVEIAEKNDVETLGQILILASKIAKKFKVENGYRLQFNQGKKAGQEIDHLHLHLLGFK